jgi:hypothetical protein
MEYTENRTIREGQLCRIHPSDAFCGIEEGLIKIGFISKYEEMSEEGKESAQSWFDSECEEENLGEAIWVGYYYKNTDELVCMPAMYFIDHITVR